MKVYPLSLGFVPTLPTKITVTRTRENDAREAFKTGNFQGKQSFA